MFRSCSNQDMTSTGDTPPLHSQLLQDINMSQPVPTSSTEECLPLWTPTLHFKWKCGYCKMTEFQNHFDPPMYILLIFLQFTMKLISTGTWHSMFQSKVCFMYLRLLKNHQSKPILWCVGPFTTRCQAPTQLPSWSTTPCWLSMTHIQCIHSYSPCQEAVSFVHSLSMSHHHDSDSPQPSLNTCHVISQSIRPSNI